MTSRSGGRSASAHAAVSRAPRRARASRAARRDRGDQARRARRRPCRRCRSAVPWSGEVRTKGRPSVTLTPPSKSMRLQRDQRLVVIHGRARRRSAGAPRRGTGCRRERAAGVDAVGAQRRTAGAIDLDLLAAHGAAFAGMGIEAGDGKARPGDAEVVAERRGDDAADGDDPARHRARQAPRPAARARSPARPAGPGGPASSRTGAHAAGVARRETRYGRDRRSRPRRASPSGSGW